MFVDKYANPPAVYAGLDGGSGVLKTIDKGETWVDLREQNPRHATNLQIMEYAMLTLAVIVY